MFGSPIPVLQDVAVLGSGAGFSFSRDGTLAYVPPLKLQMKRSQGEYVFVKEDGITPLKEIKTAFYATCRRAKLTGVTPHVLRHTFASRLVMNGADLRTVQELGGWKSMGMVERYSHLSDRHKAEAVELIGRKDFTTLSTTPKIVKLPSYDKSLKTNKSGHGAVW